MNPRDRDDRDDRDEEIEIDLHEQDRARRQKRIKGKKADKGQKEWGQESVRPKKSHNKKKERANARKMLSDYR